MVPLIVPTPAIPLSDVVFNPPTLLPPSPCQAPGFESEFLTVSGNTLESLEEIFQRKHVLPPFPVSQGFLIHHLGYVREGACVL